MLVPRMLDWNTWELVVVRMAPDTRDDSRTRDAQDSKVINDMLPRYATVGWTVGDLWAGDPLGLAHHGASVR